MSHLSVVAALALAVAASPVLAQDPAPPGHGPAPGVKPPGEAAPRVPRAYVLRLRQNLPPAQVGELVQDTIRKLKLTDSGATVAQNVPGLRGILITTTSRPDELRNSLREEFTALPLPDYTVRLFDEASCGDAEPVQPVQPLTNICRVTGVPAKTVEPWRVWVVDSGMAVTARQAFNIASQSQADCTTGACNPGASDASVNDDLGHGTMVAGVVAAQSFDDGTGTKVGVDGVSPGGEIIPVKVFGTSAAVNFWIGPLAGLMHVAEKATPGDVVNISWGGRWIGAISKEGFDALRVFDSLIAQMADKGIRVVIAAGNADRRETLPPWVGFVTPANSRPNHGTGSKVNPLGGVYVVSAVNSRFVNGAWSDAFWVDQDGSPLSYFGEGPPDYAQPGVGIKSMWHSERAPARTAVCSGTSFAAPHLSGLLSRQRVGTLMTSQPTGDPDGKPDPVAWFYPTTSCQ